MLDKILSTIKKLLGGSNYDEDTTFDTDILIQINTAIDVLFQLGYEPARGFICEKDTEWEDLVDEEANLNIIKTYIYAKVRKAFDPPQSGTAMQALNDVLRETEWRINVMVDPGDSFD